MRRLLVKLVAIETAFLGWLSYWLFLVYANNPAVASQLAGDITRFPQLSFTTVDISVLVIIAFLSIILAFKFHRGLRPGIRLERALKMLENLMKRNLILEAQVAELKVEQGPQIPESVAPSTPHESPSGSWEKAFRTPLEAGPPLSGSSVHHHDMPFGNETGLPPPRIESRTQQQSSPAIVAKPPVIIADKGFEKPISVSSFPPEKRAEKNPEPSPFGSSGWEDSPKYTSETRRILTPSQPPKKALPNIAHGVSRPSFVPGAGPKRIPPSVIVGAMSPPPASPKSFQRPPSVPQASPRGALSPVMSPASSPPSPPTVIPESSSKAQSVSVEPKEVEMQKADLKMGDTKTFEDKPAETKEDKETLKPVSTTKKKFPYEQD
ncbi:MAG TPA: hypothetical protein VFE98_01110 [Candidatus Bathyarchaeia archaeon]|nr:hypothetical protein [Candidatus Bathyarchaeia archaeon]